MKDRFHGFITEGLKLRKESSNRVAFDHIIGTSLSREFCQLWFTLANFQQPFYQNSKSWLLYVLAYELVFIMYLSATFLMLLYVNLPAFICSQRKGVTNYMLIAFLMRFFIGTKRKKSRLSSNLRLFVRFVKITFTIY